CRFGLARHYDLPKPADFVPHTSFRMGAVFSQRCSPEGCHDARYLSGCAAVHRATGPRPGDAVFRAWNGNLAATSNRLVVSTKQFRMMIQAASELQLRLAPADGTSNDRS